MKVSLRSWLRTLSLQILSHNPLQEIQELADGWTIRRVVTTISQADDSILVDDKITSQLGAIALYAAPSTPGEQQSGIGEPDFRTPRSDQRAVQTVGLVGFQLRIQKKIERQSGFLHPGFGSRNRPERNYRHLGIESF